MLVVQDTVAAVCVTGLTVTPEIVGGLATVTLTTVAGAVLPAASRAMALRSWLPLVAVTVFQLTLYGDVVSSAPRLLPSSLNCTPTPPTLSLAAADTVTSVPETVTPAAGTVIETSGGTLSRVANVASCDIA